MLAYVGDDHAVFGQTAEKFIEKTNCGLRQPSRIKLRTLRTAGDSSPAAPIGQRRMAQLRVKRRNRVGQISNHRQFASANAIKLSRIDFKVDDLRIGRKASGIPSHTIIE